MMRTGEPVQGAMVYRLPVGQTGCFAPYRDGSGRFIAPNPPATCRATARSASVTAGGAGSHHGHRELYPVLHQRATHALRRRSLHGLGPGRADADRLLGQPTGAVQPGRVAGVGCAQRSGLHGAAGAGPPPGVGAAVRLEQRPGRPGQGHGLPRQAALAGRPRADLRQQPLPAGRHRGRDHHRHR